MFRGLIASMPAGTMGGGFVRSSWLSALVHVGVIGAAVVATRQPAKPAPVVPVYLGEVFWHPIPPREKPADLPHNLRVTFPIWRGPVLMPTRLPPISPPDMPNVWQLVGAPDSGSRVFGGQPAVEGTGAPVDEMVVDERPVRIQSPPLDYPPLLRQAGIEGVVTIEVVIDTTGRPESGSLRVVRSDHRGFEMPARQVVLRSSFSPGRMRGQAVRVLVQIPVSFAIRKH